MPRATVWTLGLFGAGATLVREFSVPWAEPVVLLALGIAFLLVSSRPHGRRARGAEARDPAAAAPAATALGAARPPSAAAAPMVVEQSV